MKFPYLYLQLWDRDLLKWSDCAGELTYNLGRYYRKAFKRNVALKLFEQKQGAAARRAKEKELGRQQRIAENQADIPIPEEGDAPQGPLQPMDTVPPPTAAGAAPIEGANRRGSALR